MKEYKVSVIICAGGKGERAGFGKNKLLVPLHGAPLLWHTFSKFDIPEIDEVITAVAETDFNEIAALSAPFGYKVVLGGPTRTKSVKNALKEVTGDMVLIHDGARPYVSRTDILSCIESVKKYGSGICAIPFTDTAAECEDGRISKRLSRDKLYRLQTPQGFFAEDIKRAYELCGEDDYTDDSAVFGTYIAPCRIFEGSAENIKLTHKSDFINSLPHITGATENIRIGFGADTHAFGKGGYITLAGVKIPHTKGLIAHSDGDVIIHAVIDALLSAAGMRDIGFYFPDSDKTYKNADSGNLLKETVNIIKNAGYKPHNISVTVQAEEPKLSPYIEHMKFNLSALAGIFPENTAISAGTCEGLGFVGQKLGITAYCSATVIKTEKE